MFGKFMIIFAGKWPVGSDTRTYKWGSIYPLLSIPLVHSSSNFTKSFLFWSVTKQK
ncbi:hypothetical protein C0J52_10719 [Blattella germanica]|nr:hypothetical protein C0J52_10719 [Blattella germanica]